MAEDTSEGGELAKPDDAAAEKRAQKRFDWFTKVGIPLICVTIGVVGKYAFDQYSNRMRVIRYAPAVSSSLLPKPDLGGKQLVVTLDGKPIDNISTVTLHVFNDNQDLENVPLYVTFAPIDGKVPKLILAQPKLAAEAFKELPVQQPTDSGLRLGYEIAVLNRSHYLQADFIFEGSQAPAATMFTVAKGVKVEPTTLNALSGKLGIVGNVIVFLISMSIAAVGFWLAAIIGTWLRQRREAKLAKRATYT